MDFISPFIEPIISHLWNPMARQVGYLVRVKRKVEKVADSMEDLRACKDDLQKDIDDAQREQKQSTHAAERWLQKVREAESKVGDAKHVYENRGCRLFGDCSLNCCLVYKTGRKVTRLLEEVITLKSERLTFGNIARMQSLGRGQLMPTQSTTFGLDQYVEQVRSYLTDDSVGIIGIYGMGGVGKTTILKAVNNSLLGARNVGFKYIIWIVVTEEPELAKLQEKIAKNLRLTLKENDDMTERANFIYKFLEDKSFVFFFDDVWKQFDLLHIGIPDTHYSSIGESCSSPAKKMQKVVLTTRFKKACGSMGAEVTMNVECLNKHDARSLFKEYVGERNLKSNPGIQSLVDEVADECAGLPLALIVIGKAMSTKTTLREWQKALISLRRSRASDILDGDDRMFTTLMYSYDNLKDDALRKCFLCCSLWPEDHDIDKEDIIAYLIGLGVIKDFSDITEAYDEGHCILEDLKAACLLESGSNDQLHVKMHDVLRDMALWIASDCGRNQHKWLVKAGRGMRKESWVLGDTREVEVVSLMHNNLLDLPNISFECPKLLTLMFQGNRYLQRIHPNIFQYTPALVCLDLSRTDIKELPPSIGTLKMLQYLNLAFTKIRSLPKELGSLKRLQYLDLCYTFNLIDIPSGLISSLLGLRLLNLYSSRACLALNIGGGGVENTDDDDSDGGRVESEAMDVNAPEDQNSSGREPSPIDEMESLPGGMKGLGIFVGSTEFLRRLSKLSRVSIWRLHLTALKGLATLSLHRSLWQCLQLLSMESCKAVEVLEIGVGAGGRNDRSPVENLEMTGC